jgi:hypothetical protein
MECILVSSLKGATPVPSMLFSVSVFPCLCQQRRLLVLWWWWWLSTNSSCLGLPCVSLFFTGVWALWVLNVLERCVILGNLWAVGRMLACGCGLGLGYLIIVDLKPKFYLSKTWVVPLVGADLDWMSKVAMLLCD